MKQILFDESIDKSIEPHIKRKDYKRWLIFKSILLCTFVVYASASRGPKTAQSGSAKAGEVIEYSFEFKNEDTKSKSILFQVEKPRLLACEYSVKDNLIKLPGGETYFGTLSVKMSDRIPKGAYEKATLLMYDEDSTLLKKWKFITVRSRPHPFLLVTDQLLDEAKEKIENCTWARENFQKLVEDAKSYEIPKREIVTKPRNTRVWDSFNYSANTTQRLFEMALAWKLTGDTVLRDKVVKFVREVCDKKEGYLSIGAATTGVQVHEGNFFQYLAAICDILYGEEGLLSEKDRENIETTFRYYIQQSKEHMNGVGIMNHQASANAGALLASLFMQDIAELDHLMNADGGFVDQLSKGTMPDGWWFEGTVNYGYLVTHKFAVLAQAFENYGWNLYDRRFPVKYKSKDFDNAKEGYTGMKFDVWGPNDSNTIGLEEMFSAYISMMDENAYVVSSNDSDVTRPHVFYELAYRHFKKDELAWVINHSNREGWEALIYGVPEIPKIEDPRTKSDYLSNVGLVALRSQKEGQDAKNQIQAYLKFGTHGGWHGHFDRTGLLALDRNGHKYFGTEMTWFGYGHAGYKECVQTSATHNMVVVDELQQEALPSEQTLFYAGDIMQVSVVETNARWRKIPTFNRELFPPWDDKEFDLNFEPVLQRRLTIVTDDYVVVADYMYASQEHQYDWMLHPIGFNGIEGAKKTGGRIDSVSTQFDSPYKYFTNGQWYEMNKGAQLNFLDGEAKLNVHTLWPQKAKMFIANYPNGGKQRGIRNNPDRRTYAIRQETNEAYFLNILEPYQSESAIKKIESSSFREVKVILIDGREQTISIKQIEGAGDNIQVGIEETKNGKDLRKEASY